MVLEADNDTVKLSKLLHSLAWDVPTKLSSKVIKAKQTDIFKCDTETFSENVPFYNEDESRDKDDAKPDPVIDSLPSWSIFPSSSPKLSVKHQWKPFSTDTESSEDN